jgi:hypothetical protein
VQFPTGNGRCGSSVAIGGDDGTIYFTGGSSLYAFSPDGSPRWPALQLEEMGGSWPAIGCRRAAGIFFLGEFLGWFPRNCMVVFGANAATLYSVH